MAQRRGDRLIFQRGDQAGQRPPIAGLDLIEALGRVLGGIDVADRDHMVDHALQAHGLTVLRRENARDTVLMQLVDLLGHDHATATAKDLDVGAAALPQQVDHVLEKLDVPPLVGTDGDTLGVFLQGGGDDILD